MKARSIKEPRTKLATFWFSSRRSSRTSPSKLLNKRVDCRVALSVQCQQCEAHNLASIEQMSPLTKSDAQFLNAQPIFGADRKRGVLGLVLSVSH